jgi:hypothetical protein
VVANVSLNQPAKLSVGLNTPVGTNGYHISCFQCANGTAIASPTGGISPYLFHWSTGASTNSISNLNRGEYRVTVTDANGCAAIEEFAITEPEREDWAMAGNSNINSNINYLGTTDSNSFGLRTNSIERFKIAANGEIKLSKYASPNSQILSVDQDGVITPITIPTFPSCTGTVTFPWQQSPYDPTDVFSCWRRFGIGTDNPQVRLEVKGGLSRFTSAYSSLSYLEIGHDGGPGGGGSAMINNVGTGDLLINYNNSKNVKICTGNSGDLEVGGNTYLASNPNRNVGIGGTYVPPNYKLAVNGKIICEEVFVKLRSAWPDYVFKGDYKLMPINDLKKFIIINGHLPELKSQAQVENEKGFSLGDNQVILIKKIEELTLYIIEQEEKILNQNEKIEFLQSQFEKVIKK